MHNCNCWCRPRRLPASDVEERERVTPSLSLSLFTDRLRRSASISLLMTPEFIFRDWKDRREEKEEEKEEEEEEEEEEVVDV